MQTEGIHAFPFEHHSQQSDTQSQLSITQIEWEKWFFAVINLQEAQRQQPTAQPFAPEVYNPHLVWQGNPHIQAKIATLWKQYGPISNQRASAERELSRTLQKEERSHQRLYDDLKPYHKRIPPLQIYLVNYEQPLDYLLAPSTVIMTVQNGQPQAQEFKQRVLTAAVDLANKRYKTACLYPRITAPPRPPKPTTFTADDPAKQVVFNDLNSEHNSCFDDFIDQSTVQFIREKNVERHRLYEISCKDIDGKQYGMIYILRQNEDGTWAIQSASSHSVDLENPLFKLLFAPTRAHPQIFLSGGWTSDSNGNGHFHAYGHIIDNGFHVTRVQLTNNKQVNFEDTVEDHFVFFYSQTLNVIDMPLQALLYNREGELVWQQTVFDHHHGPTPWEHKQP